MAENPIGALLGGEAEEAPGDGEATVAIGLDPAAAAAAVMAAGDDPTLSAEAAAYFRKQARLVDIQTEHLHEQRAVSLSHLKLRRLHEAFKVGTQVFFILVATGLGLGALVMLSDAVTSRSVIVEPFDAPPALAASGFSGKVVAGGLLDELTRLQAATRSAAAKRSLANDWTGDIKVDIPETGISISEIGRLLHQRFGHDLHIGGDLVQTQAGGLAMTVRGDGVLPKAFTGGSGDLGKLTTQAAEYVYGKSQPALFVRYLGEASRDDEAIAFAKAHLARASLADRPYLLNTWADSIADKGGPQAIAEALPLWREAVRIRPHFWSGYANIVAGRVSLGDEEGAVQEGRQMLKAAGGRPGKAPEARYANYDETIYDLPAYRGEVLADVAATGGTVSEARGERACRRTGRCATSRGRTARLRLATAVWDPKSHPDAANAAYAQALLAERGRRSARRRQGLGRLRRRLCRPGGVDHKSPLHVLGGADIPKDRPAGQGRRRARCADEGGRHRHFVDCYRFRGDVLDLRGDWTGAQAWYARAVNLAPEHPLGKLLLGPGPGPARRPRRRRRQVRRRQPGRPPLGRPDQGLGRRADAPGPMASRPRQVRRGPEIRAFVEATASGPRRGGPAGGLSGAEGPVRGDPERP